MNDKKTLNPKDRKAHEEIAKILNALLVNVSDITSDVINEAIPFDISETGVCEFVEAHKSEIKRYSVTVNYKQNRYLSTVDEQEYVLAFTKEVSSRNNVMVSAKD